MERLELFGALAAFLEGRRITIAPGKGDGTIKQFAWVFLPIKVEEIIAAVRKPDIVEEPATVTSREKKSRKSDKSRTL
jgi:hypothetical protein